MISIDNSNATSRGSENRHAILWANIGMLFAAMVWGLSFVSTKVLTEKGLQPVEIYLYRFIIAYLILAVMGMRHGKFRCYSLRDELLFLLLGMTGGSLYFVTENIAVTLTDVANVSLITTLSPLITVFIMGALYKSERPGPWMIFGSSLAICGVVFVVFGGAGEASLHPAGDFLALCAAVSFSIYSILIKKVNATYSTLFITRKSFFYGIVTALPFLLMEQNPPQFSLLSDFSVIINIAFLGLICSMVAFMCMARCITVIGPVKANNYLYVQPIVTLIAGGIILHQDVGWQGWLGCALIIGGLWLGEALTRRQGTKRP